MSFGLHARDPGYHKRLGICALMVLISYAGLALLPLPQRERFDASPGTGFQGLALVEIEALGGTAPEAATTATMAVEAGAVAAPPPEPEVAVAAESEPIPEPVAGPVAGASEAATSGPHPSTGEADGLGASSGGHPGDPPGSSEISVAMRPRHIVHPRVPHEILRKRKIDDFVMLQARLAPDGNVLEVRVLRTIPNCDECTASALEAARQYRYDPPVQVGAPSIWTEPFNLYFKYHR